MIALARDSMANARGVELVRLLNQARLIHHVVRDTLEFESPAGCLHSRKIVFILPYH